MTAHPFSVLEAEYLHRLSVVKITRGLEVNKRAVRLVQDDVLNHYRPVAAKLGIPIVWMATSFERESGSNFSRSPAQGDPWNKVSTHVPKGRGPFTDWAASAIDAYHFDGLDKISVPAWSFAYACWKWEAFNGFGPRAHGRVSGYLWAGTDQYDPPKGLGGKYVADGVWSSSMVDVQLGCVPLALRMIDLKPELMIAGMPSEIFVPPKDLVIPVTPTPLGLGTNVDIHDTLWIQKAMNALNILGTPLQTDNNYGRRTREVVRVYQQAHGLEPDGLVGPKTIISIVNDLKGVV